MTQTVVDIFEVIKVQKHQCQGIALTFSQIKNELKTFTQLISIGQTRELIKMRQVFNPGI